MLEFLLVLCVISEHIYILSQKVFNSKEKQKDVVKRREDSEGR